MTTEHEARPRHAADLFRVGHGVTHTALAVALAMAIYQPAFAQESPATQPGLAEVIITGSRIQRSPDLEILEPAGHGHFRRAD